MHNMFKRLVVATAAVVMVAAPALLTPAHAAPHVDTVQPSRVTGAARAELAQVQHAVTSAVASAR
jgi:hypothetical protein